jgi:Type IX secretion system protein PorV
MKLWIPVARRAGLIPVVAALVLAVPAPSRAAFTAGAASLQIPPGARAEGMGRFYQAVADDPFAPWWNPAGLAFSRGWSAGLMHANLVPGLVNDVYYEYLSVGKYLQGWGGVAGTFTYLNYGESQGTEGGGGDLGTFNPFEMSPSVAIGTAVLPNLGVGLNLKLIHVDLTSGLGGVNAGEGKGTSFGVDVGALWRSRHQVQSFFGSGPAEMSIGLGAVAANLGPNISLGSSRDSDPLPRTLRLGAAWGVNVPQSYSLLAGVAVDKSLVFTTIPDSSKANFNYLERNDIILSGGLEVGAMDLVFARLGYIYDEPGSIKSATFGLGIQFKQFSFDFASIPQSEDLDRVKKFSIVAKFD